MNKIIFVILGMFLFIGCEEDSLNENLSTVDITVYSQDGEPVAGATISGGIDWDAYSVQTNEFGQATIPGSASRDRATIYKTNYHPTIILSVVETSYILKKTEKRFDSIGSVLGKSVSFKKDEIITLDYGGTYRVYSYNDDIVTETFSQSLGELANAIKDMKLYGDILWFTTHDSGIFAFSIANSTAPQLQTYIPISGYLGPFAVKDSILVLGNQWEPGPVRVMVFKPNGEFKEISRVENYFVRSMKIIQNHVILLGNDDCLPTIFNISDPYSPSLVYNGIDNEFQNGFFYNDMAILTPDYGYGGNPIRLDYKIVDLSNPSSLSSRTFTSDSWISGIVSNNIAIGRSYSHSSTISLLEGSNLNYFNTIATVSEGDIHYGVVGAYPPYYLIGDKLWKLNSWE